MNFNRIILMAAKLLLLLVCSLAQAETPALYWGVGYSKVDYTSAEFAPDPLDPATTIREPLSAPGLALKTGITLRDWIGLEVQYGIAKESNSNVFGDKLEIRNGAAFARFSFPFPRVNLYLLGGAARVTVDTGPVKETEDYYAAGMGLDLMANETSMLYLEVMRYEESDLESEDPYMNIYTIGYKHHFEFAGMR